MASTDQPSDPGHAHAPRPAATVVIARPTATPQRAGEAFEIFMLQRSARSPFMPSTLVFPGGRLDEADGSPGDDATWVRAGRRECAEEAGLDPGDALLWFDTWLTPSAESRRRYLARFFLARLSAGAGEDARADGTETHQGRWDTVAGHLGGWQRQEIDLPPPTLCILLRLRRSGWADLADLASLDPRPPILPKVDPTANVPTVVLPHDSAYAALPGEALPAPDRAHIFPRRLARQASIWTPLDDSAAS